MGSLNGDIVLKVKKMPKAGETIAATEITKFSGGKGSNQAGACAKLGAVTTFLCQVGKYEIATMILDELRNSGADVCIVKIHGREYRPNFFCKKLRVFRPIKNTKVKKIKLNYFKALLST